MANVSKFGLWRHLRAEPNQFILHYKGGKLVKSKDWFQGYRPVIQKHLEAEAKKS